MAVLDFSRHAFSSLGLQRAWLVDEWLERVLDDLLRERARRVVRAGVLA